MQVMGSKHERIVEAVRRGLEGDAAVAFVQENGFPITVRGIARILHAMGGRKRVEELIANNLSNYDILRATLSAVELPPAPLTPPEQQLLFTPQDDLAPPEEEFVDSPLYEMRKLSIKVPSDLFEAIRLAAKAEKKSVNALIVEILTVALSQMPRRI